MSEELKVGETVCLTRAKIETLTKEWRKAFNRKLKILAREGEMVSLSNGEDTGLCRMTCSINCVRKVD